MAAKTNAVAQAIDKVGGGMKAAAIMGVQLATAYRWKKAGVIPLLVPALRLAKAAGVPVEKFAPPEALE